MNTENFLSVLEHPKLLDAVKQEDLKIIINEFPYFQSARALYLKKLKQEHSFTYNDNLKVTAAYTTDRSILFDFITSEEFNQNNISEFIKKNALLVNQIDVSFEDISEKTKFDSAEFSSNLKANEEVSNPNLFEEKIADHLYTSETQTQKTEASNNESQIISISEEENRLKKQLELGKPLDFNKTETHSFSEWLNLTQLKPINRNNNLEDKKEIANKISEKSIKINKKISKKNKLIEAFIAKNHRITAKKSQETKVNIAKAQMIPHEELMTETLARIYLEQKNYKKAIQSYKILSLKYPEKSGFFADQIKAVKQLQENNKL